MPRTVKHSKLESRNARANQRLIKRGRQAHWQAIGVGAHLGYQRGTDAPVGRWLVRTYLGNDKYRTSVLGVADDAQEANGTTVLSFAQAQSKAQAAIAQPDGKIQRLTVRQAMDAYVDYKSSLGQSVGDILSRGRAHILPPLGDRIVSELTPDDLRRWLAKMAACPPRPARREPRYNLNQKPSGTKRCVVVVHQRTAF